MDLKALYLSGIYCHKTGTRPPSCAKPWQRTINSKFFGFPRSKYKKQKRETIKVASTISARSILASEILTIPSTGMSSFLMVTVAVATDELQSKESLN